MTLKVGEGYDSVLVKLRNGATIEGPSYSPVDDYVFEKDGMTIHLGQCFIVNKHVLPVSLIKQIIVKVTEVRDVVVFGGPHRLSGANIERMEE